MSTIKILGAGPAGLTAAIILARAGRAVVVYERAPHVGALRDGDMEALENWTSREDVWNELTRWGLVRNFASVPFYRLTAFGPGFHGEGCVEDTRPLFYWSTRGPMADSLDCGLLEQARAVGVHVEFNRSATPDEVDIIAGGLERPRAFAVGYNFQTHAANGAYICLDDSLTPHSYAYLVLRDGQGTVAACAPTPQNGMKQSLSRVVEGFHARVEFDMCHAQYFAASVGFGLPRTAIQNGKLFIGEAGGFQDIMAGFGMRMGMTTGYLAARSILDGCDYDDLWHARCWPILKASAVNRWLQRKIGQRGYPLLLGYTWLYPRAGRAMLRRHYHPMWYTPLFWPLAQRMVMAECASWTQSKNRERLSAP